MQSCDEELKKRRAQLVADGILRPSDDGNSVVFTKDFAFDSPSGAAGIVYGGNVSGPRYWQHSITDQLTATGELELSTTDSHFNNHVLEL